jgi:hypothetical protein
MPTPRRTLLSVMCLEARENPGDLTYLDPTGITVVSTAPVTAPITVPPPDTTTTTAIDASTAIITGMTTTTTTDTNSIYKVPLIP